MSLQEDLAPTEMGELVPFKPTIDSLLFLSDNEINENKHVESEKQLEKKKEEIELIVNKEERKSLKRSAVKRKVIEYDELGEATDEEEQYVTRE